MLHATEALTGARVVIIGFMVRDHAKLEMEDRSLLDMLLGGGTDTDTGEQQLAARKSKRQEVENLFMDIWSLPSQSRFIGEDHVSPCAMDVGLPALGDGDRDRAAWVFPRTLGTWPRDCARSSKLLCWRRFRMLRRSSSASPWARCRRPPFEDVHMDRLRQEWFAFALLPDPEAAKVVAEGQPFYLEALSQTSRFLGDEDWEVLTRGG